MSNRLFDKMVKKGGMQMDANSVMNLKWMEGRSNANGKMKAGKSSMGNKENTPLHVHNMGSANIDKIIQYIEGGPQDEAAYKKAQKKARQKQKKDEEKRQREEEEEALRKAEEERLRKEKEIAELQRIREELALQKSLKKAKKKQLQQQSAPPPQSANENKSKKKKGKESKEVKTEYKEPEPELFEQTIPAMVTIKRIIENNNSPPTVTITLKGSTPDQDKLLYTLVNGHDAPIITSAPKENNNKQNGKSQSKQNQQPQVKTNEKQKKKKNGSTNTVHSSSNTISTGKKDKEKEFVQTNEIKVQLAIDNNFRKDIAKLKELKLKENNQSSQKTVKQSQQVTSTSNNNGKNKEGNSKKQKNCSQQQQSKEKDKDKQKIEDNKDIIDLPSIKLPPGITITKVCAPLSNPKLLVSQNKEYPAVPVSKSGVIVVDTEKLIQQQSSSKKKKKKGKKTTTPVEPSAPNVQRPNTAEPRVLIKSSAQVEDPNASSSSGRMITLKNPIFHPLQNKPLNPESIPHMMNINEQATISHGENGMVTIRRPRPVGFMPANESPISEYKAQQLAAEVNQQETATNSRREHILTPWQMPDTSFSALSEDRKIIRPPSPKGIQWPRGDLENGKISTPSVLQGLPGIEITRVRTGSPVVESEYVEPPANVSIIRTGGFSNEKLRFSSQP